MNACNRNQNTCVHVHIIGGMLLLHVHCWLKTERVKERDEERGGIFLVVILVTTVDFVCQE